MATDGLLLCAREAAYDLQADPTLERVDDVLYCVTAVARSSEARADSLAAITREVCGDDLLSGALRERLPEWRSQIGVPLLNAVEERLKSMPVGEFLLLPSEEADPDQAQRNRELLLGVFHHRDLLEAAAAIDVELGGSSADWPIERADAALRGRILRALCCNDLRRTVARDMRPDLAHRLWWWSKLSNLAEDALGQWVLGDLELDVTSRAEFDELLRLDGPLSRFLQECRDVRQGLSKGRAQQVSGHDSPFGGAGDTLIGAREGVSDMAAELAAAGIGSVGRLLQFPTPCTYIAASSPTLAAAAASGTVGHTASLEGFRGGSVSLELDPTGVVRATSYFDHPHVVYLALYDPDGDALVEFSVMPTERASFLSLSAHNSAVGAFHARPGSDLAKLRLIVLRPT